MLINKKAVKQYTLDYCLKNRSKFTRISNQFFDNMDSQLRNMIDKYVQSLPSIGKTVK